MKIDFKTVQELEFNNLGEWPVLMVVILSIVISLGILFLGYCIDIKPKIALLAETKQEEVILKNNIHQKNDTLSQLPNVIVQVENLKKILAKLIGQLPQRPEIAPLVESLSHQGVKAGLTFLSIRLQPERAVEFYSELPVEMAVTGGYHQFGEFVSNVASMSKIITLQDFIIHAQDSAKSENKSENKSLGTDKLVMNITAKIYVSNYSEHSDNSDNLDNSRLFVQDSNVSEYFSEPKPIQYSAASLRSPFSMHHSYDTKNLKNTTKLGSKSKIYANISANKHRKKEFLEAFSVDALKFLGILEAQNKRWAVVKDSQGAVHRVSIGNYMGLNEGQITAITEDAIQLTEMMPDGQRSAIKYKIIQGLSHKKTKEKIST